ncbi:hypothetical protein GLOIN_2v1776381 [Rhizophagus clarus]|uniref:Uncharacterized protein n=1 Tax=Rhizophagus clarus TaxID=94130 RepID=A0A8H3QYL9_9GLOM|nr:hypothetical protein GLOIN_2v1776381 [Rhizophagus clarus]
MCDRIHIPVLVRESFVEKGLFISYIHEAHDIAQQILTHFSTFCMYQDDVVLIWIENAMRILNKILQNIPKDIARVYLVQSVISSSSLAIDLYPTCIKILVSFDDFEQFAKSVIDLMDWQSDATVRSMNICTDEETVQN